VSDGAERDTRALRGVFWLAGTLLGLLHLWPDRFGISSEDAIAYLDVGDAFLRADWRNAFTGYWSPLYPWIQAGAAWIARPSTWWEFPLVNGVNFLIFLLAMAAFDWLLREFLRQRAAGAAGESPPAPRAPDWIWVAAGYALFLWASLAWTTIRSDTPDLLTAALLYATGALILRNRRRPPSALAYAAVGAAIALGGLGKTAVIPLAPVLLLVAMLATRSPRAASWRMLAAPLAFVLILGPYLGALSRSLGHPTFGETGKLNYAWLVNPGKYRIPDTHWQGGPPGSGEPVHPSRVIFDAPRTFEFGTPLGGTYPPWTDPSYWYEGLETPFSPGAQIRVIALNLGFYWRHFLAALLFGVTVAAALDGRPRVVLRGLAEGWPLLVPSLAGLGIYLVGTDLPLVSFDEQPSMRLVAPFAVLLCAGAFLGLRVPGEAVARRWLCVAALAFLAVIGARLAGTAGWDALHALRGAEHAHYEIARSLEALGLERGAAVAVGNDAIDHVPWARLGRWRIVAETRGGAELWRLEESQARRWLDAVAATGARAIVLSSRRADPPPGWHRLGDTSYHALWLDGAHEASQPPRPPVTPQAR
jgi:hypothetical protein